jgi:hypothetical protein
MIDEGNDFPLFGSMIDRFNLFTEAVPLTENYFWNPSGRRKRRKIIGGLAGAVR